MGDNANPARHAGAAVLDRFDGQISRRDTQTHAKQASACLQCPICGGSLRRKASGLLNGKKRTKPRRLCSSRCRQAAHRAQARTERAGVQIRNGRKGHRKRDESQGKVSVFSRTCWPVDLIGGRWRGAGPRIPPMMVVNILAAEVEGRS